MKTTKNITITVALIFTVCFKGFANYNFPFESIVNGNVREVSVKPSPTSPQVRRTSFTTYRASSGISALNFHGSANSNGNASLLDKLGIKAGCVNTYHHFLGCPYAKGVAVSTQVKYSALLSLACVWDISWGVKHSCNNEQNTYANNMNIIFVMSNPAPGAKEPGPFMRKLDTNLPLQTLSIVELVVSFGHL